MEVLAHTRRNVDASGQTYGEVVPNVVHILLSVHKLCEGDDPIVRDKVMIGSY